MSASIRVEWVILSTIDNSTIATSQASAGVFTCNTSVQGVSVAAPSATPGANQIYAARVTAIGASALVGVGNSSFVINGNGNNAILLEADSPKNFQVANGQFIYGLQSAVSGNPEGRTKVDTLPGLPQTSWTYAPPSGGVKTTANVTLVAATSGQINLLTSLDVINRDPNATEVELTVLDQAANTVIWRTKLSGDMRDPVMKQFVPPLPSSVNSALIFASSANGTLYVNAGGYTTTP